MNYNIKIIMKLTTKKDNDNHKCVNSCKLWLVYFWLKTMKEIYGRRRTNIVPIEPISQCSNRKIKNKKVSTMDF